MLGIVLDKWSPNAHNGSIDGKSYFVAPEGRGLLVPLSAVHDVVDTNADNKDKNENDKSESKSDQDEEERGVDDRGLSNLKVGDEVQLRV